MRNEVAVLISDIHFTIPTLELASQAFLKAQFKAKILGVPLVVMGDTLDTKAVMRAECVNRLIELVSVYDAPPTIFLVGNHDLVNEKASAHSLNFLKKYTTVVDSPRVAHLKNLEVLMIPYKYNLAELRSILQDKGNLRTILMHQGLKGSASGEYFYDQTALNHDDVKNYRVISGHYHARQDIKTGDTGLFSYVGNPYTLNFGEANDPSKGYQILKSDGTLDFISLGLRRHVIYECDTDSNSMRSCPLLGKDDLLLVRVRGSSDRLTKITKEYFRIRASLDKNFPFKLDLIPTDTPSVTQSKKYLSPADSLDKFIDSLGSVESSRKERLKKIFKTL